MRPDSSGPGDPTMEAPGRSGSGRPTGWRAAVQGWEARATKALRSPAARIVGTVVGVVAFLLLLRQFVRTDVSLIGVAGDAGVPGLIVTVVGFTVFHVMAVATLRALGAAHAGYVWGTSQLVKYLPVPGAAVVGMAGAAVRSGADGRGALRLVVVASVVRVGAAMTVGALAVFVWLDVAVWLEALLAAAVAGAGWILGVRFGGVAATTMAAVGWLAAGAAIAAGTATGEHLAVGAAYALAWVAGQLALPVPAGLGVREFVLVGLLTPVLGSAGATVVAVVGRLIHTASDVVVAGVAGLARSASRLPQEVEVVDDDG